jgi:Ca-activated chloride channel homolog
MIPVNLELIPEQSVLAARNEAQICYTLLRLSAGSRAQQPVCWGLVADASRSMRIPIISEAQFRDLVREGGAQEVLVDGLPVWQLAAPVPPEVRAQAPSALDYTVRALHSLIERMAGNDRLTVVACAEEATLLSASISGNSRDLLVRGIARLAYVHPGERTDLAAGLRLALEELDRGRAQAVAESVERLVVLTDGFTEEPEHCLELARQAARRGVAVSTLGLGGEFQAELLTQMADLSGGRAMFLPHPDEIPAAIAEELRAARAVTLRQLRLQVQTPARVRLRRVTRIQPVLAPLTPAADQSIWLGDLEGDVAMLLLLEFLAPAQPQRAPGELLRLRLAQILVQAQQVRLEHDLIVQYADTAPALPAQVLDATARASAAGLQQRALAAAASGDAITAARLLRATATRLHELGDADLAAAAEREAALVERNGQLSDAGAKELTYSTRRLGK